MRETNKICDCARWFMALFEKRNMYEEVRKARGHLRIAELEPDAEAFAKLAIMGCRKDVVSPEDALLQAFTMKADMLALPAGFHKSYCSEEMLERKFMLTGLELRYISDGEENVYCSVTADFADEDGEHHADVGCLRFNVKKGTEYIYMEPWSMNVFLGDDFADQETMGNITSLLANVWNGTQHAVEGCLLVLQKRVEELTEEKKAACRKETV